MWITWKAFTFLLITFYRCSFSKLLNLVIEECCFQIDFYGNILPYVKISRMERWIELKTRRGSFWKCSKFLVCEILCNSWYHRDMQIFPACLTFRCFALSFSPPSPPPASSKKETQWWGGLFLKRCKEIVLFSGNGWVISYRFQTML